MEIEAVKGAAYRAAAESAFLLAVQNTLPPAALEEVATLTPDEIPAWATRLNVHARCVIQEAPSWGGDITVAYTRVPAIPDEWDAELRQMNALPIGGTWLWGGIDDVMSDGSRREEMGKLKALPPDDRWRRERAAYLRDELPSVREARLLLDRNLAPIGADSLRESEARFLERARDHFRGRVSHAKRMGYVAVAPIRKYQFACHLAWLVRFQLRGESRAHIARTANAAPSTVAKAIRHLAAVLELTLRSDDSAPSSKAT